MVKASKILLDIRKAKRSVALRDENDTAVVLSTLEAILHESIAAKSLDSHGAIGKAAIDELVDIRNALIANQIKAGKNSSKMIGKYSLVIDEMRDLDDRLIEERKKDEVAMSEAVTRPLRTLMSAIPSPEAITAALITANPVLGYGFKIITDVFSGIGSSVRSGIENKREQDKMAKEYAKQLEHQLENLDKEEELIEKQIDCADDLCSQDNQPCESEPVEVDLNTEDVSVEIDQSVGNESFDIDTSDIVFELQENVTKSDIIISVLRDIKDLNAKLYNVWQSEDEIARVEAEREESDALLRDMAESQTMTFEVLDNILEEISEPEDTEFERDTLDNQSMMFEVLDNILDEVKEANDITLEKNQADEYEEREFELENRNKPDHSITEAASGTSGKDGVGMFEALGITRLGAMFSTGLGSFVGTLAAGLGGILAPLATLGGVGLGIAGAVAAIYSFTDGFITASDIIDKEESDITTADKLLAGYARLSKNMYKVLDWGLGLIGIDLFEDGELDEIEKDWLNKVVHFKDNYKEYFSNWGESMMGAFGNMKEAIFGWYDRLTDEVSESIEYIKEGIADWFKSMNPVNIVKNRLFGYADIVEESIENDESVTQTWFRRRIDNILNTGEGMRAVDDAYINMFNSPNAVDQDSIQQQSFEPVDNYTESYVEQMVDKIEHDNSEHNIDNSQTNNLYAPVNNVTNNNVNQQSRQPQAQMGLSQNLEPSFRRFINNTQSYSY